jgi:hypothetical protein
MNIERNQRMAQTLKQQIRRVIRQHYGDGLSLFRDEANYRDGTEAFVTDVARAIRGELEFVSMLQSDIAPKQA